MSKETNPHHKANTFYLIEIPIFFLVGFFEIVWAVISFPFKLAIDTACAWTDEQRFKELKRNQ